MNAEQDTAADGFQPPLICTYVPDMTQNLRGERKLAWNTCKFAHWPWRLSRSPALAFALPGGYFEQLGVPRLYQCHRS